MSGIKLRHASSPLPYGDRAWAYAVGAPYHVAHGLVVDAVVPDEQGDFQREMFSRDWGIQSREDLVSQMNHLGQEGHRRRNGMTLKYYAMIWRPRVAALREECRSAIREGGDEAEEMAETLWRLDAVQADKGGIRSSPLLAFDAARAVMLTRVGMMLGWLDDDEAWSYMLMVARDVQRTYTSWEAYGTDFVLSRNVWAGDNTPDIFDDVIALLLKKADSPWRTLPWGLSLALPDIAYSMSGSKPYWTLES